MVKLQQWQRVQPNEIGNSKNYNAGQGTLKGVGKFSQLKSCVPDTVIVAHCTIICITSTPLLIYASCLVFQCNSHLPGSHLSSSLSLKPTSSVGSFVLYLTFSPGSVLCIYSVMGE